MAITIQEAIRKFGRKAEILSCIRLERDWYHRNIAKTATKMVERNRGHWEYDTQFKSGNCRWTTQEHAIVISAFDHMLNHQTEAIIYFAAGLGTDLDPEEIGHTYAYLLERHGSSALKELDEEEVAQWIIDANYDTEGKRKP